VGASHDIEGRTSLSESLSEMTADPLLCHHIR
jgi:hypothetical protein